MLLEQLLQINIATLAALGALLLGMGQRDAGWPLLVMLAAFGSVWLCDVTGWLRLSRNVANVAALVAVVVVAGRLQPFSGEAPILAAADLFVYLQIILLFQRKDDRVYWQLIMLSLLQVVAATVFSQGLWFGVLLVVYMLVGFSSLSLLWMHRQWLRFRAAEALPANPPPDAEKRWPLSGQRPQFSCRLGGRDREGIGRELFSRLTRMGFGTLVLTLLMFLTLPRFGRTAWRGAVLAPKHVVGFSDEVQLGELGEIIESREEVMRVWLRDEATGRSYPARGELYLRGSILTYYRDGQWADRTKTGARSSASPLQPARGVPTQQQPSHSVPVTRQAGSSENGFPLASSARVRQQITIEPLDRDELFCIWPFQVVGPDAGVQARDGRLFRRSDLRRTRFSYELTTSAMVDGVQVPLIPCDDPTEVEGLLQLPELPELSKLAGQWIAESGLPPDDPLGRSRELARRFHDPKRFQYSLEGQARNLDVDPIEDFVSANPRGHCEYFATALAMMLRSQRIPSRVVLGYKCGALNDAGKFYQVRQLHAHAWVEAYLPPEDLPPDRLDGDRPRRWACGGWLRLEPTPAGAAMPDAMPSMTERIADRFQWLQSLWADYVIEMDRQRQRDAIYQPTVRVIKAAIRNLRDPGWWRGLAGKLAAALHLPQFSGGVLFWLWFVPVVMAALLLLTLAGRRLGRWLRRVWGRWSGRPAAEAGGNRADVEFYRRFERLLARNGLIRRRGQTPREFAADAAARLAAGAGCPHWESLSLQVVEAFYRVRFGRLPLDSTQAETVEQALGQIAAGEPARSEGLARNLSRSVSRSDL
ncbi:MAG: DUF3488 domain-containing protein [Pirellulales bacterium]|nr:DUF3488 domain-containing protein [Pirellulales bacterium]